YQSHHGTRLHFGLGDCDRVERIEVRWLGGGTQVIDDVGADQLVVVVEDG
ncbi:MAG: ASPIC/UnbV domain-containing protein, partial [Rhodopirellula sp.]|nr:ASPIC/UnbV domain-containing protein [Rhodopirellula sp.]